MTQLPTALVTPVDNAILQRIEQIEQFQGRVFEGNVPDGDQIPTDRNGFVLPYVTVIFGGLIQTQGRNRGIVGARGNLKYHTVMLMVTGATDRQAREMADLVRDHIEGWEPFGASELSEETSGNSKYPADNTLKPTRYTQMLAFSLLINP